MDQSLSCKTEKICGSETERRSRRFPAQIFRQDQEELWCKDRRKHDNGEGARHLCRIARAVPSTLKTKTHDRWELAAQSKYDDHAINTTRLTMRPEKASL
jgi:hypothetical protein